MNKAVDLREDNDPWERTPNLARSLRELGISLSVLKRYKKAFPPTEKAVVLRKKLTCADPRMYNGDLAFSLYQSSRFLHGLRRYEEALSGERSIQAQKGTRARRT